MFRKHEINPYPVADKVTFRNVDKTCTLCVRADAMTLVSGLKRVNERLSAMKDDTPEDEQQNAARMFADTLFGEEQGAVMFQFYKGDALAIITACGMYFRERLSKKITKAQKTK